jgi:hypothetical protein
MMIAPIDDDAWCCFSEPCRSHQCLAHSPLAMTLPSGQGDGSEQLKRAYMKEYILRRLVLLIPTVLGVTIIVFLMMHFIPGDPVALRLGDYDTEGTAAAILLVGLRCHDNGIDRLFPCRSFLWAFSLLWLRAAD